MGLSDRFEQALEKARGDMRKSGHTERLEALRDIVTQLREVGINADLRLAEDHETGTPSGSISESYPRKRFILEIDDAKFGVFLGKKVSHNSGFSSSSSDQSHYVWLSYYPLTSDTPGKPSVAEYDVMDGDGRKKLEDKLLAFAASRFAARKLMPGADAKSNPANTVRKRKTTVRLGQT